MTAHFMFNVPQPASAGCVTAQSDISLSYSNPYDF